jgi:hypothetical protein
MEEYMSSPFENKKFCPVCKEKGMKSCVYGGTGNVTLMHCPTFWDEDGNFHSHDINTSTATWRCSQGHTWITRESGKCWCGWSSTPFGEALEITNDKEKDEEWTEPSFYEWEEPT